MTGPKQLGKHERNAVPDGKTALGRVRGLGAAGHGGEHWIKERVSSAALLLLGTWFLVSLLLLPDLQPSTLTAWLSSPLGFVPMALFVYEGGRMMWHIVSLFLHVGAGAFALFALARIAFGA